MATSGMTKDDGEFLLNSLDVYVDDDTLPTFFTRGEKTISFSPEFAKFVEGVPQVLVRQDLIKFGIAVQFKIMQFSAKAIELSRGGKLVTGTLSDELHFGTNLKVPATHKFRFVGETVEGKAFELTIWKGSIADMPDLTTGGGDYADHGVTIEALRDSTIVDTERNLAKFTFEK